MEPYWMARQRELHRQDRARYNLVHPIHGTITKARADELWAGRGMENEIHPSQVEHLVIMHLWDQLDGGSSYMSAFFIYLNQEIDSANET